MDMNSARADAVRQAVWGLNPDLPVALCVTTNFRDNVPTIRRAAKRGDNYIRVFPRWAMPMIAVLWPRSAAERFRDWALANPRATGKLSPRSDDAVGGAWMSRQRETVLATVPSLVEHEDTVACTRQEHRRRSSGAARTDDDGVVVVVIHRRAA